MAEPSAPVGTLRVGNHMSAEVRSIGADVPLREAARLLARFKISCLVVVGATGPVGIVSERDVVRAVDEDPEQWFTKPVREVMSHPLHVTETGTTVAEAIRQLGEHRIRRLPVLAGEGQLAGIVTQTDLLRAAYDRLENYASDLEQLVSERTAELISVERARDDIVDLTAHDIKNSLCTVDSALHVLAESPDRTEGVMPLLRRATARIANLVCTMLDVSRLENGSMPLRLKDVPWAMVCDHVLAEAALMAEARDVRIVPGGERRMIVRCDPSLVERVLLNLLDNAITAAPEGSEVEVQSERLEGGTVAVLVGNRGRAVPADVLPLLFQKFSRGDTTPAKRFGGWGLGLAFCRSAIELHGGTIEAISPWVNDEGTAFRFVLPPAASSEAEPSAQR